MNSKTRILKTASALGLAGIMLTACGGEDPTPSEGDNGNNGDGSSGSGSYSIAKDWDGCETLDNLQPIQDYLEATGGGELTSSTIGTGSDAEAMTCGGTLDLQTFEFEGTTVTTSETGNSTIQVGFIPWDSAEEATQNLQSRIELFESNPGGIPYTNVQEGEPAGNWDEGMYFAADGDTRYYISSYARHGDWVAYISMDISYDPGRTNYEAGPELFPDSSADEMAVYPHTIEEVTEWVTTEYMAQLESSITEKLGGE